MKQAAAERALTVLRDALHQDIFVVHRSLDEAVAVHVASMAQESKSALRAAVHAVLANCTDAELKGILNRLGTEIAMNSKAARHFFELVSKHLESA